MENSGRILISVHSWHSLCCEMNLQQLWRQVFCRCRSEPVEQLNWDKLTLAFNDLNGYQWWANHKS